MSKQDDVFYREFGVIVGCIFIFFLIALFAARIIGTNAFEAARLAPGEVAKRIQPVGQIAYGEDGTMAEAEPVMEVALAEPRSGQEVYESACTFCHKNGTAGAPMLGDTAAWEPRAAQGIDILIDRALNGSGDLMPAKGGRTDFSDEEVIAGLKFMLKESGISTN